MNKKIGLILLGLILIALTGCANNEPRTPQEELQLVSTQSSVGSVYENNFDVQKLTYQATLYNAGKQSLFVAWVEPVLVDELTKKSNDLRIDVQKNLEPGQSLEVKGELQFDTKGLSKQDIIKWEPFLKGFKISNERFLKIN